MEWITRLLGKTVGLDTRGSIAETAAGLRARYGIRTPDAIQLATAINAGAKFFFTNDLRLPDIEEIDIISLNSVSD